MTLQTTEQVTLVIAGGSQGPQGPSGEVSGLAEHEAAADPHPGYLTPAEGDLAYDALGAAAAVSAATTTALADKVDKVAGKGLSEADFTDAEKTKLAGVEEAATANSSDAALRDRATHTGEQAISTVTGLQDALDAKEPTIASGTTAQYWRGDKTWRDFFTDVRAATLTGLSTATGTVVTSSHTVLEAIGFLQKQITDIPGGGSGGDMLSTLLNSVVTIDAAITLDATACGKMHHLTFPSAASYGVELPDPTANTNKFIGLQMWADSALYTATITATGGSALDGQTSRIMLQRESAILWSDGARWTRIGGRSHPVSIRGAIPTISVTDAVTTTMAATSSSAGSLASDPHAWNSSVGLKIPRPGLYRITSSAVITVGANALLRATLQLRVNGSNQSGQGFILPAATASQFVSVISDMEAVFSTAGHVVDCTMLTASVSGTNARNIFGGIILEEKEPW